MIHRKCSGSGAPSRQQTQLKIPSLHTHLALLPNLKSQTSRQELVITSLVARHSPLAPS